MQLGGRWVVALGILCARSATAQADGGDEHAGDRGLEVAAVAVAEGTPAAWLLAGAVHLDAHVRARRDGDVLEAGADAWLEHGGDAWLRGSPWLRWRHEQAAPARDPARGWVTFEQRFDYELRVPLARRRDVASGRLTGGRARVRAVLLGGDDELEGGALLPLALDVDVLGRSDGGVDALNRFQASALTWWTAAAPGAIRHERTVLTIDSHVHDLAVDRMVNTIIFYGERGRRASDADVYVDFRIGFASNGGKTTIAGKPYVNTAHPEVTAGILDGAVHVPIGAWTIDGRYDRAAFLTQESSLALEDRVSVAARWTTPRAELSGSAFVAHTRLWSERDPDAAQAFDTRGVRAALTLSLGALVAGAEVEVGKSFYVDAGAVAAEPRLGARAQVSLAYRLGSAAPRPLGGPGE